MEEITEIVQVNLKEPQQQQKTWYVGERELKLCKEVLVLLPTRSIGSMVRAKGGKIGGRGL